jgi:hypothetical protein
MSGSKAKARPKHTAPREAESGIATAAKLLRRMRDDLDHVGSHIYVSIEALRANSGNDCNADIARVLDSTYVKLLEHIHADVRNALKALGQDGAQ